MRSIRSILFAFAMLFIAGIASAQYLVSVNFGPPALPIYEQPPCPGEDFIWMPGYWAWSDVGYYWIPGTWVQPPEPDLYWTPGYWAYNYDDNLYNWYDGYWAPEVGYYGGIDYGYGYPGDGYYGGYWRDRHFYYNQAVNNVTVTNIRYVYVDRVVNTATRENRVSYNGGPGGTTARPSPRQPIVAREQRVPPTPVQQQHIRMAREDRALLASENQGKPPVAATARPAQLNGSGVTVARQAGAPWHPPANRENRGSAPANRPENRDNPRPDNDASPRPNRNPNEAPRREAEPGRTPPDATPDRNEPRANPQPRPEERDRRAEPAPAPRPAPEERERRTEPAPRPAPDQPRTEPEPKREPPQQARPERDEPPRNERANEVRRENPGKPDNAGKPGRPNRPDNKPDNKPDKKSPPPEADDNRPH